jgi:hypothetical protein
VRWSGEAFTTVNEGGTMKVLDKFPDKPRRAKKVRGFFEAAGFGKRIEFWLIGQMLKEGLHVFIPLVDDIGIDAVIRKADGTFVEVQIKARSENCKDGTGGLFNIRVVRPKSDYWYVFHSERMGKTWLMNTQEFLKHSREIKRGKYPGLRWNKFNRSKKGEPMLLQFEQFVCSNFNRIKESVQSSG